MPMGLTNAPATFMRTMKNLFSDPPNKGIVAFVDDILICNSTFKEYEAVLKVVFRRL